MKKKIKIGLIVSVVVIIFVAGLWIWNNHFRVIEDVTNQKQALVIAQQTTEAREFMNLYPNAVVDVERLQPLTMVPPTGWGVSYVKNPEVYPNIVYLIVHVNDNGTIEHISPENAFTLIKNRKYCDTDNDCLSINCSYRIDYVNYIHAYAEKCSPLLSCVSGGDLCHSYFISSCINHECRGKNARVKIPTKSEALETANKTEKVRKFLKSHPNTTVSIEKCCCGGGVQGGWDGDCEENPDFRGWCVHYKKDTEWISFYLCPIRDSPGFRNF